MEQAPTIDRLLNLVPDSPSLVLSYLQAHPELASKQDSHGYSLLHAATSYQQLELAKALILDYRVDPNIRDEDGETCLFNVESLDLAKELLDLGVDPDMTNSEGETAAEKLDDEDEQPDVALYLNGLKDEPGESDDALGAQGKANGESAGLTNSHINDIHPPPPLPDGVQVNVGTMLATEAGSEPDPLFRRRIEELAARQDFEDESGQRELRDLVSDAVSGMADQGQGSASRRRLG